MYTIILYLLCCSTAGVPSQGGDYIPSTDNFILTPGSDRACVELFVFQDNFYELTEDLSVLISGFINDQGMQVASLPGVSVRQDRTQVEILDSNSELWI